MRLNPDKTKDSELDKLALIIFVFVIIISVMIYFNFDFRVITISASCDSDTDPVVWILPKGIYSAKKYLPGSNQLTPKKTSESNLKNGQKDFVFEEELLSPSGGIILFCQDPDGSLNSKKLNRIEASKAYSVHIDSYKRYVLTFR